MPYITLNFDPRDLSGRGDDCGCPMFWLREEMSEQKWFMHRHIPADLHRIGVALSILALLRVFGRFGSDPIELGVHLYLVSGLAFHASGNPHLANQC